MDVAEWHLWLDQLGKLDCRLDAPTNRELPNEIVAFLSWKQGADLFFQRRRIGPQLHYYLVLWRRILIPGVWVLYRMCWSESRAIWGGLLPSVSILSAYFIIADTVLIFQIRYFRKHPEIRRLSIRSSRASTESNPLLPRRTSFVESPPSTRVKIILQYAGALAIVIAAGILGWALSSENHPRNSESPSKADEIGPKFLGYLSAIFYLSARIPQIYHNYKLKSTEGLSLLFFMFSTLGNVSFTASIMFALTDMAYFLLNLPWLIGSAGTVFFDFTV